MALFLSVVALLATFYQLYLQRTHNEKSLKPLIQIDVRDDGKIIYVRVQNNGLGPYTIDRLSFIKDGETHNSIRQCISLNPLTYHNISVTEKVKKVILPNNYLDVFSVRLKEHDAGEYAAKIKAELSALVLKVEGRDIYDNLITIERDLDWFTTYAEIK